MKGTGSTIRQPSTAHRTAAYTGSGHRYRTVHATCVGRCVAPYAESIRDIAYQIVECSKFCTWKGQSGCVTETSCKKKMQLKNRSVILRLQSEANSDP
eukprot:2511976-Rhodomonas_salina.1